MKKTFALFVVAAGLAISVPAEALCVYNGKHFEKSTQQDSQQNWDGRLYAKTTLADEFADAALVVRGTAVSSRNVPRGKKFSLGTVYNVRVEQVFKGRAPGTLRYFTERNSGMFDLEIGKPFLLFLDPLTAGDGDDFKMAPGAYVVNYNCGVSRPWAEVNEADRMQLTSLTAGAK